ncbi:unnamed protein product [Spirodela intermedia]|uniref:WRC domain-containing protein n=1 Tax=Spirodela intermedia TaxID=51605 RepID=A0A7I8L225_SPIIN|nr:unnamed protein product [Spirodela intermedia]
MSKSATVLSLGSVSTPVKPEETSLPEKVAGRRTTSGKKMFGRKKALTAKEGSKEWEVKIEVESAAKSCNKSDGKGWSCKRDAQLPYSLCDHHLDQVRSYIQRQAPVQEKKKKKKKKKKTTKNRKKQPERENCGGKSDAGEKAKRTRKQPSSDFYHYYYYGFGPGRGRRRSGKERGTTDDGGLVNGVDGGGGSGGAGFLRDRPARWLGDDDDDDVVGDLGEECDVDDVIEIKRKGRKPMKARSLKSLL